MANPQPWQGSATFTPNTGQTPFGLYDSDQTFATESVQVADYCAKKLGYPMMEVELQDTQFFACFEEAVSTYALEIYQSKIQDNYFSLEGSPTGSSFNNQVIVPTLNSIITIADTYGQPAGVGGNIEFYTASIALVNGQQTYDLQLWASSSGLIAPGDKIVVQRIFYTGNPAINQFYDPYIGGSINYQGATENFGWASYSPGLNFTLFPVYWDIQRIQEIEMSNIVRRSAFTFELVNNKLKVFPRPQSDGMYLWVEYSLFSDLSNTLTSSPYNGNTGLITNPSNVPYETITYSQINWPGKQWIREYTLALASELLGLIRGKYQQIPVPGETNTLNGTDLITKGQAAQQALRERLRIELDNMTRKAQLERKALEVTSMNTTLTNVPLLIFIG
jgi:hypothetical protein